jgi:hypothetical protein
MELERVHVDLDRLRRRLTDFYGEDVTLDQVLEFLMEAEAHYVGDGWFIAGVRGRARLVEDEIIERISLPIPRAE